MYVRFSAHNHTHEKKSLNELLEMHGTTYRSIHEKQIFTNRDTVLGRTWIMQQMQMLKIIRKISITAAVWTLLLAFESIKLTLLYCFSYFSCYVHKMCIYGCFLTFPLHCTVQAEELMKLLAKQFYCYILIYLLEIKAFYSLDTFKRHSQARLFCNVMCKMESICLKEIRNSKRLFSAKPNIVCVFLFLYFQFSLFYDCRIVTAL